MCIQSSNQIHILKKNFGTPKSTICSKLHFNHLLLTTQHSKHQMTLRRLSSLTSVLCMQKVFAFGWFGWYPLLMWPLMQTVCKVFLIYIYCMCGHAFDKLLIPCIQRTWRKRRKSPQSPISVKNRNINSATESFSFPASTNPSPPHTSGKPTHTSMCF